MTLKQELNLVQNVISVVQKDLLGPDGNLNVTYSNTAAAITDIEAALAANGVTLTADEKRVLASLVAVLSIVGG